MLRINAATSPAVTYPQGTLGRQLTFRTLNFLFIEKRRYYILLDPGECCMKMKFLMRLYCTLTSCRFVIDLGKWPLSCTQATFYLSIDLTVIKCQA